MRIRYRVLLFDSCCHTLVRIANAPTPKAPCVPGPSRTHQPDAGKQPSPLIMVGFWDGMRWEGEGWGVWGGAWHSRKHCVLLRGDPAATSTFDGDDADSQLAVLLEDSSRNGTYVNGDKVSLTQKKSAFGGPHASTRMRVLLLGILLLVGPHAWACQGFTLPCWPPRGSKTLASSRRPALCFISGGWWSWWGRTCGNDQSPCTLLCGIVFV